MSRSNETEHSKWHETSKCKCRLEESFVIINNVGIKVSVDVNVKNWLAKVVLIQDLFTIL